MRKWITLLMTFLVAGTVSYANANTGQVTFEAGYRHDNIDWKARFPSDSPFLKSNTKFKDLDIFQIGLHGRTTIGYNFYIRANAYWGWVLNGDFRQDVHTYASHADGDFGVGYGGDRHRIVDDRWVYGIGGAIGYPFYFCDCTMVVAPVIGYAIDEQNLSVEDEGFDIRRERGFFVPVSGNCCCNHKFITRWFGPFVGVDFNYRPYGQCWNLYAELEYHWGDFQGKRDVHSNFDRFGYDRRKFRSHNADGWVFSAGADYDLNDAWTVGLAFKFQDWRATKHHRRHGENFNEDYADGISGRERQNFKWHSYEVKLALGKDF